MKIFKDLSQNYPDCIVTYFNYENYENYENDFALYVGYNNCFNSGLLLKNKNNFNNHVFLNDELPCSFTQDVDIFSKSVDFENNFSHIFSICHYTNNWMNENFCDYKKFFDGMFVIDEKNIIHSEKIYDSIFYGSICGKEHENCVNVVSKFNHNFITLNSNHWHPNDNAVNVAELKKKITFSNIHTFEKWKIISQTKVVPIINKLYLHDFHIENIKKHTKWDLNEAWKNIDKFEAPQVKPRIVEASLLKSLMVVLWDDWNEIELWFTPEKDFIYFHNFKELEDIIYDVSKNYEKYNHIVDNAYKKALSNFTTENMLQYYKRVINEKI